MTEKIYIEHWCQRVHWSTLRVVTWCPSKICIVCLHFSRQRCSDVCNDIRIIITSTRAQVFWDVTLCHCVSIFWYFIGMWCIQNCVILCTFSTHCAQIVNVVSWFLTINSNGCYTVHRAVWCEVSYGRYKQCFVKNRGRVC